MYVNYARTEDFFKLEREMNINCTGKIVIARYGKIFRGNKVQYYSFWREGERFDLTSVNGQLYSLSEDALNFVYCFGCSPWVHRRLYFYIT